jgi:UDP-glucose 4-epimerase
MVVRSLRYANVYGPRQSPHGEAGVVAIFGSRLRNRKAITVYGDGMQTRDYVFVGDVARANLLATEAPAAAPTGIDVLAFNVGTGVETSVNGLAQAMMAATGIEVPMINAPARPGELQRSSVNPGKAAGIGWTPQVTLADGLRQTYEWIARATA